MKMEMLKQRL